MNNLDYKIILYIIRIIYLFFGFNQKEKGMEKISILKFKIKEIFVTIFNRLIGMAYSFTIIDMINFILFTSICLKNSQLITKTDKLQLRKKD